jgi:hypothetical protein
MERYLITARLEAEYLPLGKLDRILSNIDFFHTYKVDPPIFAGDRTIRITCKLLERLGNSLGCISAGMKTRDGFLDYAAFQTKGKRVRGKVSYHSTTHP